jgi:hypothetical protein
MYRLLIVLVVFTFSLIRPNLNAQDKLSTPTPTAPNGPAGRNPLWQWRSVKGAEAYRITAHFPAYSIPLSQGSPDCNPPHGVMNKPEATVKALVSAAACTEEECQAVLSYSGLPFSPLTKRTAISTFQVNGKSVSTKSFVPAINGHGLDCRSGKSVTVTYTIQALSGYPNGPAPSWQNLPWKDESTESEQISYTLDEALPSAPTHP